MAKICSISGFRFKCARSFSPAAADDISGSSIGVHMRDRLQDVQVLSGLLKECSGLRSISLVEQIHSAIVTGGQAKRKFVMNHLMNAYAKLSEDEKVMKVFDKMPDRNIMSYNIVIGGLVRNEKLGAAVDTFNTMLEKNTASWNAIIAGLINFQYNDYGLRLFTDMHSNGFLLDEYTLGSALKACAGLKDLRRGKQVHCYMIKSGLQLNLVVGSSLAHMYMRCSSLSDGEKVIHSMPQHNVIAFNTLIAGLVQNGDPEGALDQYHVMKMAGFKPDNVTFASVITSCTDLSTLVLGQQIHAEVLKAGFLSVPAVTSSFISMYSRSGCLIKAERVFNEREETGDDHVVWTSIIAAYGLHGRGEEAIEIFRRMEIKGMVANDITFLSILYACSHSGLKDQGLEFFNLMVNKYGLEPKVKHYTCVVDLLGRAGRIEEAETIIKSMPMKPDPVIWKTLLSACKTHKNTAKAESIAKMILSIDPQDSASYVLLSNSQATVKNWLQVEDLRQKMKAQMISKDPGMSWFETNDEVHRFIIGDSTHPQWKEINSYLEELILELRSHGYVPETSVVLHDMDSEEKAMNLGSHTEKLAVAFALMKLPENAPIRIMKNLRVCDDCHAAMKHISMVRNREIVVRDSNRFHHFRQGVCSCRDYW